MLYCIINYLSTYSELQAITNREVFYPCEYVQASYESSCILRMNGWKNVPDGLRTQPLFNGMESRTIIPIYNLSHITHADQAMDITPNEIQDYYKFKPNLKKGRDGTYEHVRGSFVKIQHYNDVLPGKYSWWEIDTTQWYSTPGSEGNAYGMAAANLQSSRYFLAPYLSNPRESMYGNYGFVVDFKELLKSYMDSRTDIVDPNDRAVCLRVCGTFEYRYEICYVVMVCTKYDHILQQYPSLFSDTIFDIAHNGQILEIQTVERSYTHSSLDNLNMLTFEPQYLIKCAPTRQYSCYETPAFAFYFPEDGNEYRLKCAKESVTCIGVNHYERRCRYCQLMATMARLNT